MTLVNHAHNIHYQWALEMGWPVAIFLSCVLGVLIFRGARAIFSANNSGGDVLMLQGTVLSCLVLILHSELEYPLWYVYFLLPFSYWLGLLLLVSSSEGVGQGHGVLTAAGLRAGGVVAMFVLVYALLIILESLGFTLHPAVRFMCRWSVEYRRGGKVGFLGFMAIWRMCSLGIRLVLN